MMKATAVGANACQNASVSQPSLVPIPKKRHVLDQEQMHVQKIPATKSKNAHRKSADNRHARRVCIAGFSEKSDTSQALLYFLEVMASTPGHAELRRPLQT